MKVKGIIEHNRNKRILTHCVSGISRSASILIGCLMLMKKLSLEKATKMVKSKREIIDPNNGFIKQLENLETEMKKKYFVP